MQDLLNPMDVKCLFLITLEMERCSKQCLLQQSKMACNQRSNKVKPKFYIHMINQSFFYACMEPWHSCPQRLVVVSTPYVKTIKNIVFVQKCTHCHAVMLKNLLQQMFLHNAAYGFKNCLFLTLFIFVLYLQILHQ